MMVSATEPRPRSDATVSTAFLLISRRASRRGKPRTETLEAQPRTFWTSLAGDSCGCAMGARFLAGAMVLSMVWLARYWRTALHAPGATAGRVLGCWFVAAILGKAIGIVLSKPRRSSATVPPEDSVRT